MYVFCVEKATQRIATKRWFSEEKMVETQQLFCFFFLDSVWLCTNDSFRLQN